MVFSQVDMVETDGMCITSIANSESVRQQRLSLRLRRWSFLAKAPAHLRPCAPELSLPLRGRSVGPPAPRLGPRELFEPFLVNQQV